MNNLIIEAQKAIPAINFNANSGELSITGSSYPENALDFFDPVVNWIEEYVKDCNKDIVMNINLDYFNTSSSKGLLDILDILNDTYNEGNKIAVKWFYQEGNDSILESGEEFAEDIDFPFEIIETKV